MAPHHICELPACLFALCWLTWARAHPIAALRGTSLPDSRSPPLLREQAKIIDFKLLLLWLPNFSSLSAFSRKPDGLATGNQAHEGESTYRGWRNYTGSKLARDPTSAA